MCPKTFSDKQISVKKSILCGKIKISGAKNSALKLLTASLLTDDEIVLTNSPNSLLDMKIHAEMLEVLGKKCIIQGDKIRIQSGDELKDELVWDGPSIRNTLLMFGALLSRKGKARVPLPGGCKLGDRKIDLHIMILEKMGAKISEADGYLVGDAPQGLRGENIYLSIRSTGATENAIISGCLAKGKTVIWGPHIRPEIMDLIKFLRSMGADIEERGQESIIVRGVESMKGAKHRVISDNMEAMTFLIGAAITGGKVEIENFPYSHLEVPLIFMRESGLNFSREGKSLVVQGGDCFPVEIATGPYPSINSDMQPLFGVYALQAKGESRIIDLRFSNRYKYTEELRKMGGDCRIKDNLLYVFGGNKLRGCEVVAHDLRCGAALLLAGLIADKETIISNAWQLQRGYEDIVSKMKSLGGKVSFNGK